MLVVQIQCPACSKAYSVDGQLAGRKARCRQCGLIFPLPATSQGIPDGTGSASGAKAARASGPDPAPASLVSLAGPAVSEVLPPAAGRPDTLPEQFGRYRIIRTLGRGGMGAVYLAHDTQLDRQVALKVPHFTPTEGADAIERFYREARAAATLDHPNLCPVYDVGQIDGTHYLTMPYIEGKPLSEAIDPARPTPMRQAAAVVRKLALALHEAHSRGIVHRDLKPANIMANRRRELVIMDFGLARRLDLIDARLTQSGALLGTPLYMSPEQVRGDHDAIGPASDIYSLGVILYELLAGRRPFDGPVSLVLAWVLVTEPPRLSEHRPDLDPTLEAICQKAMAKKPEDRYATMAEFAAALGDYLAGQGTAPPLDPSGSRRSGVGINGHAQPGAETLAGQFLVAVDPDSNSGLRSVPRPRSQGVGDRWTGRRIALATVAGAAFILLGVVLYVATDRGTIKIIVDDPDATITLDDRKIRIEASETVLTLRSGQHKVQAHRADGAEIIETIHVQRGTNDPIRLNFPPVTSPRDRPWDRPPWIEAVMGRAPIPNRREADVAEKAILDEFKGRQAEGKLDDRAKLARELLEIGDAPTVRPTERYAQLRLANQYAGEAADYTTALKACEALGRWFEVDVIREKFESIETHARFADSPAAFDDLATAALGVGFEAIGLEDYRFGDLLVRLATSAARKADVRALMDQAAFLAEEMEAGHRGYDRIRKRVEIFRGDPQDPGANAAVGQFLCLVKRDWPTGLPMLARGDWMELRPWRKKNLGRTSTPLPWWPWATDGGTSPSETNRSLPRDGCGRDTGT